MYLHPTTQSGDRRGWFNISLNPGAGFNGRANNLIFVLKHVQTTKN